MIVSSALVLGLDYYTQHQQYASYLQEPTIVAGEVHGSACDNSARERTDCSRRCAGVRLEDQVCSVVVLHQRSVNLMCTCLFAGYAATYVHIFFRWRLAVDRTHPDEWGKRAPLPQQCL